jgi:hypothetical protein
MFLVFFILSGINIAALMMFAAAGQGLKILPFKLDTFLPQLSLGHLGSE